jgi:hypothetical protein
LWASLFLTFAGRHRASLFRRRSLYVSFRAQECRYEFHLLNIACPYRLIAGRCGALKGQGEIVGSDAFVEGRHEERRVGRIFGEGRRHPGEAYRDCHEQCFPVSVHGTFSFVDVLTRTSKPARPRLRTHLVPSEWG